MENRGNKPPQSAMAYYVKLFCKKRSSASEDPTDIQKAIKSWLSLSAAEQQPFIDKFKKCQQDYENKYAVYLKSVEPFMKKKPSRGKEIEEKRTSETKSINRESQMTTNILQNTDDIVSYEESIHDPIYTALDIDSTDQQEEDNQVIQRLPEPTPPSMINGKQLFEAVNVIQQNTFEWKDLSQIERGKYNSAVLSIKRDYIRKYHNYLESLPVDELYRHYIKSQKD